MSIEKPGSNSEDAKAGMSRRQFLRMSAGAVAAHALLPGAMEESPEIAADTTMTEGGETIPSSEGLQKIFEKLCLEAAKLTGVENYKESRKEKNEDGIYLWEMEFPIEDGVAEFGYMRKGKYPIGGSASFTKIYITFYDESGMPEGGHDVAIFSDGKWTVRDIELPK